MTLYHLMEIIGEVFFLCFFFYFCALIICKYKHKKSALCLKTEPSFLKMFQIISREIPWRAIIFEVFNAIGALVFLVKGLDRWVWLIIQQMLNITYIYTIYYFFQDAKHMIMVKSAFNVTCAFDMEGQSLPDLLWVWLPLLLNFLWWYAYFLLWILGYFFQL